MMRRIILEKTFFTYFAPTDEDPCSLCTHADPATRGRMVGCQKNYEGYNLNILLTEDRMQKNKYFKA